MSQRDRPKERYQKIFDDDPLLFTDKMQSEYGRAILHHLLINRAISSCNPHEFELNDPTAVNRFLSEPRPVLDQPSAKLVDDYFIARAGRVGLPEDETKPYQRFTMFPNGEYTKERTASFKPDKDGIKYNVHADALKSASATESPITSRLRIATIGFRVGISTVPDRNFFSEELCVQPRIDGTVKIKGLEDRANFKNLQRTRLIGDYATWRSAICNYVNCALNADAHVIVIPEFALPPAKSPDPIEDEIYRLSKTSKADHFLFAGTRHEGLVNHGLICSKTDGVPNPIMWHGKSAPAKALGENIIGPRGTRFPTYITTFNINRRRKSFAIMVAICYDSFDTSMFLNLVMQSRSKGNMLSIIIVPSFNTSADLVEMLRDLSFIARCVVVYVNGLHGDSRVFIYGVAVLDLASKTVKINNIMKHRLEELQQKFDSLERSQIQAIQEGGFRNLKDGHRNEDVRTTKQYYALKEFKAEFAENKLRGALENLITIEGFDDASPEIDVRPRDFHQSDILYYNIDLKLLEDIESFRSKFFGNDEHLAEPFQDPEFRETLKAMRKKNLERTALDVC